LSSENIIAAWCCLNPDERNATIFSAGLYAILPIYMEKSIFDAFWDLTVYKSRLERRETFIRNWYLIPGVFINEEGLPVDVYYFDPITWIPLALWALNPDNTCEQKCLELRFQE
jgi:hypothetical protein